MSDLNNETIYKVVWKLTKINKKQFFSFGKLSQSVHRDEVWNDLLPEHKEELEGLIASADSSVDIVNWAKSVIPFYRQAWTELGRPKDRQAWADAIATMSVPA